MTTTITHPDIFESTAPPAASQIITNVVWKTPGVFGWLFDIFAAFNWGNLTGYHSWVTCQNYVVCPLKKMNNDRGFDILVLSDRQEDFNFILNPQFDFCSFAWFFTITRILTYIIYGASKLQCKEFTSPWRRSVHQTYRDQKWLNYFLDRPDTIFGPSANDFARACGVHLPHDMAH